jgi:hypothetical protein
VLKIREKIKEKKIKKELFNKVPGKQKIQQFL